MDKVLDPKVLESAHNEYKLLEAELASMINARQAFLSQLNENDMVRKELEILEDGCPVFKLIGPVLVAQDLDDAKATVNKRIDFIKTELTRVQKSVDEKTARRQVAEDSIRKIQQMQQVAAQAQAKKEAQAEA